MVSVERVSFVTSGHDADERLIREYVVPALERLESIDGCTGVRFSRFGMDPRWEQSEIKLVIYGDSDMVIGSEREQWDELVEQGLVESWSRDGVPFGDQPDAVQEFLGRAYVLGSHMAKKYYETFDERPGFVEEVTGDAGRRYGLWATFHVLANDIGYDAEEEVDAYELLLRDRIIALTELRSHEFAHDRIDDLRSELDDLEATVNDLEEQGGFDYYAGPK